MDRPIYYAQFDGEDIDGTRYALGDKIDTDDLHPAVIGVLVDQGRISSNNPVAAAALIPADKPVENMNRAELEAAVRKAMSERMADADDDDLRRMVERHREEEDDKGAGDGSTGGTPYADLKDKPLGSLKTADLDTIAREEGVSFDGAKNNPDRVKAIEDARKAKG